MKNLVKLKANKIIQLLLKLGISEKKSLKKFHQGVRDRKDIMVLKCQNSGVIVLDKVVTSDVYYETNVQYSQDMGITALRDSIIETKPLEDDYRRFENNKLKFRNKAILDFGCGQGGFIKLISKIAQKTVGIELNKMNIKKLRENGFDIRKDIGELKNNDIFDFIILNHVFEHLDRPIEIIKKLGKHLKPDGELIIEVPHSKDFLLNTMNNKNFKSFTFWSEHLILHTKKSLEIFMRHSGFSKKKFLDTKDTPYQTTFIGWTRDNLVVIKY